MTCLFLRRTLLALVLPLSLMLPLAGADIDVAGGSLAGTWRFALDGKDAGEKARWFTTDLGDTITLPGTTDLAGKVDPDAKGPPVESIHPQMADALPDVTSHLTRRHPFAGVAWYQQDVDIPPAWTGQRIVLELERTKPSSVWLDTTLLGRQESLVTAHRYPFPANVTPGRHRLTVRIDNRLNRLPARGHQLADDTQTNWNGILGSIRLQVTGPLWIEHLATYPAVADHAVTVRVQIGNRTGLPAEGTLRLRISVPGSDRPAIQKEIPWTGIRDGQEVTTRVDLGADAPRWDDQHPVLHQVVAELVSGTMTRNVATTRFGLREFSTRGTQFLLNERTVLLRGRHDACVFPLTGAAPMDQAAWARYFAICKDYGLNHVRFHTWCPPQAAFAAADEAGILLQPELANFGGESLAENPARRNFSAEEARRILRDYGDSPSFVALSLGNEMFHGRETREAITRELRAIDPRHLYTQASNPDFNVCQVNPDDDYWTTFRTRNGSSGNLRGSYSHADLPLGHIQAGPADTIHDYATAIQGIPCPVISHEVGQFQVFPDFTEISKYTGPLRPLNLEIFRERLDRAGMLAQAKDFQRASGALAVINYREEVEAALRTDGLGGFQLLDLQDFPGQGTALVGILDAFLDSKGLITPEAWREFCADQVVLAKFPRYTWRSGETFTARLALANYGEAAVTGALTYDLVDTDGHRLAAGSLPVEAPQGRVVEARDSLGITLPQSTSAQRLTLTVGLAGTTRRNRYALWLYPPVATSTNPPVIARRFDGTVLAELARGGRVLCIPGADAKPPGIDGFFPTDFWCYPMFRSITDGQKALPAPGTMGLLIQAQHPALAGFPTAFHSDYQWFDLVQHSRAPLLANLPAKLAPIVQVIDNPTRNLRLGLLFEAQVGPGRLLFCGIDLPAIKDQPQAACLLAALERYLASDAFAPTVSVDPATLSAVLAPAPPASP